MSKVLVIAEFLADKMMPSNAPTIAAALKLAPHTDVLLACANEALAKQLITLAGINEVKVLVHPTFSHLLAEDLAPLVAQLAKDYTHVLAPSTTFGKNLLPRVAALCDVAMISDVTSIIDTDTFMRPIYAGNAVETIKSADMLKCLTIRTTAFDSVKASDKAAPVTVLDLKVEPSQKVRFISEETPELTRPELTAAKIVVAGGRGLKTKENFQMVEKLADKLGAAVGASRAAVDAGFVPNDLQVGQTGKVVAPTLYIAIGISGAIQHLAGMKDSKVIVAINKDAEAPIFQVADYGLVGDLFTIVPEIEKLL